MFVFRLYLSKSCPFLSVYCWNKSPFIDCFSISLLMAPIRQTGPELISRALFFTSHFLKFSAGKETYEHCVKFNHIQDNYIIIVNMLQRFLISSRHNIPIYTSITGKGTITMKVVGVISMMPSHWMLFHSTKFRKVRCSMVHWDNDYLIWSYLIFWR